MANLKLSPTGWPTDWPTDSTNYKEMLSHLKKTFQPEVVLALLTVASQLLPMGWDSKSGTCTIIGGVHRYDGVIIGKIISISFFDQGGNIWGCDSGSLYGDLPLLHPHHLQTSKLNVIQLLT